MNYRFLKLSSTLISVLIVIQVARVTVPSSLAVLCEDYTDDFGNNPDNQDTDLSSITQIQIIESDDGF